jgi:putative peptidoglycan lipid II flippase
MHVKSNGLSKKVFFQTTGIISFITLIGYPMGYVRDMLVMRGFGAGYQTDAWMIASQIPEILFKFMLFGALGASFIPVFTEYLMKEREEEAWEVACTVINFVGAPLLISIFSPGFSDAAKELAVKLTRIVFPLILILGATGLITGIYNAYLKFNLPAITGLLSSVVLIVFIIFLSNRYGIFSVAYGTVAGTVLSLALLIILLFKRGLPYKFKMNLKHPAIKNIMILMIPLIGADVISKGGAVIWRMFASFLEEGSITSLTLANRLVSIPVILFSSAAATVIFPLLSRQKAEGNITEVRDTLLFAIKMMILILLPAMIGLMVLGKPIVRLLFEHGMFDASDTRTTATVLFFSSFGLLAFGINPILYKACYALKKNWYLFRYEVIGLLLTVPFLYVFLQIMGLAGIALSGALVRTALVLYLYRVLAREMGGLNSRSLSGTFFKCILSSAIMGVICYATFSVLTGILDTASLVNQLIQVGVSVVCGAVVYFALLFLLKVDGTDKLWQLLTRKINCSMFSYNSVKT